MAYEGEVLIQVDGVGKRFCRDLKRSLWYGMKDIASDCFAGSLASASLRKDEFWALKDVSFQLRRGECLGLIGANGAGKTTLLRILNGLIKPDSGEVRIRGRVGALIALGAGFNPVLTGRENIYVNAAVLGLSKKETDAQLEAIIAFADIGPAIDAPVQTYSSGMTVRLGFAVAAHLEPDILLIDEVLAVGDTAFRMKCIKMVRTKLKEGIAVVLVSHDIVSLQRVCGTGILLRQGACHASGALHEVLRLYQEKDPENFRHVELVESKREYVSGEDMCFTIRIRPMGHVSRYRLLLRLDQPQAGPLLGDTLTFGLEDLTSNHRIVLPKLGLLDSSYSLFFALYGEGEEDFIEQGNLLYFSVRGAERNFFAKGKVGYFNQKIQREEQFK
jgi:lipopolysaccharide transport system ATP-binding protein